MNINDITLRLPGMGGANRDGLIGWEFDFMHFTNVCGRMCMCEPTSITLSHGDLIGKPAKWVGYRIACFFRGHIFSRIANGAHFSKKIFSRLGQNQTTPTSARYARKAWHPKCSEIYFRDYTAEIRENKCPRKIPAIR